ncbi:PilT protein domain protein [Catenulispora acidiphila DSM 44928]|uniref:Ribonuclease VapC n=1 Tax=Catenulispora acidiphila (strain DSM 44928 / JCM 14897 / NBRC 102108 / NRRL B-24433 / ID139908) TaxID=479433 RepID=C7PZ10_CATAD|nr:type II toxin-antitoxin system VapC family toxin [Catenulispora acidiphila]ACU69566.1 PilT protein domain protein [Catenulispora acidiphila DSM 44928]
MIIIDTNVFSELMRPAPDAAVAAWVEEFGRDLFLTAVSVAELRHGILRMSGGRRRSDLMTDTDALLAEFDQRVLPFDVAAAEYYAMVVASRFAGGRPISFPDAQIAAICQAHGALLATRNVKDFEYLGLTVIDPWTR